jgi:ketosteroid isomerase-like protein
MQSPLETFKQELGLFFENLQPSDLVRIADFYTANASFKDPFNDVVGCRAIERIFQHMFETLEQPRFVVTHQLFEDQQAFMCWDFLFSLKRSPKTVFVVKGSTHLLFEQDAHGTIKICTHRDYWDPAQEIYEKIPGIGAFFRWLRRRSSAPLDP